MQQLRIARIELGQDAAHEAHGRTLTCNGVVHPLALAHALEQPGLAQDFQVARYTWLALRECLRQVRDRKAAIRTEHQQAQPAWLPGGP